MRKVELGFHVKGEFLQGLPLTICALGWLGAGATSLMSPRAKPVKLSQGVRLTCVLKAELSQDKDDT